MKSPRFDIRAPILKKLFQPSHLAGIWSDKVRISMRNQILRDPIEHFDFTLNLAVEAEKLSDRILSGSYKPETAHRVLMEKSRGLCRQIVVPHAHDALVLQCLSDALNPIITSKAPTKKAFYKPKDQKFSNPGQTGYGNFFAWLNFQKEILRFSKTRDFVVVTDIANYYDSISYEHLRNVLSSISGAHECTLDMLLFVLSSLLWQPDYMPRIEVGLPQIDLDAPRLLAHSFLFELDEYLENHAKVDFTRYMDDIDVGVDSISEAKQALRCIDLVLQTRQVRLNSGKTRILTRSEAIHYFRIMDNDRVDDLKTSIATKKKAGTSYIAEKIAVRTWLKRGVDRREFDDGYGAKILKRLIGLSGDEAIQIDEMSISKILAVWPALREAVYMYVARAELTLPRARAILRFLTSGQLVDETGLLDPANFVTETRVRRKKTLEPTLDQIRSAFGTETYHGYYATVWFASKYADVDALFELVAAKQEAWFPDDALGRLVGGLYPRFWGTSRWDDFHQLIADSRNRGARDVYKFHHSLMNSASTFDQMFKYLKSPNTSRSTGITHAKYLCLLSALRNEKADAKKRKILKEKNKLVWEDAYYRGIAAKALKQIDSLP